MEPIAVISTAVAGGAAANADPAIPLAIKDSYLDFKSFLVRRFYKHPGLLEALGSIEHRPDSKARLAVFQEELIESKGDRDEQVVQKAQEFLDLLRQKGLSGEPA